MNPKLKSLIKRLLMPFNIQVPVTVNGVKFKGIIMQGVGGSNFDLSEPWMVDALRRLLFLRPGAAFVDVGVNIGQTLLKLKSLAPDIVYVGFEPNPFCVRYTQELIRVNQFTNCEIIPAGLSDYAGVVTLIADSEADAAGSMITNLRPGKIAIRRQHISVFPLDTIAKDVLPDNIGIVKIDVEGAELEAITGMKRFLIERRSLVTCEVLHAHSSEQLSMVSVRNDQLIRLLNEIDYRPYRLLKDQAQTRIVGLEFINSFNEEVWNPNTSPALCDYLFVPGEKVEETLKAFV
jgi:FkbM family methyltransferase